MSRFSSIKLFIALLSAGGILLEITLTRVLSTLYYPPSVYAVLSLAILGIGLGAGLATASKRLRIIEALPIYAVLAGFSTFALIFAILLTSVTGNILVIGVVMLVPYISIGLAFATAFSQESEKSRSLYAFDLVGAGLATLLVIPLLDGISAFNGLAFCAGLFVLAGALYRYNRYTIAGILGGSLLLGAVFMYVTPNIDVSIVGSQKPIAEPLQVGELVETRWDSFARTDLVQPEDGSLRIYVDGASASIIPPTSENDHLLQDIGLFAFVTAQPERVFSIGSGGGLDIWFAQQVGATDITAVEVNPQSVQLVRDYADYSGDLYNQAGVRVLVDEGRSVLQREDSDYDLIFLSQVVTLTSERAGYAMTENSVFTQEAFAEYLSHLTDDGYLSIKLYDEITMSRTLSLAISALQQRDDLTDIQALDHIIAMLDPSTSPPTPLLMIKNTPFLEDEVVGIGRVAQRIGFATLFLPGIQADPPLDAVISGANVFEDIIDISPADLSAPTDDRPFFYQFDRGLPKDLSTLLVIVAGIVVGVAILALIYFRRTRIPRFVPSIAYFALLGAGFMMIEIGLIQQSRLFIGHPTIAVTVIFAVVLIGGGLGSALYQRLRPNLSSLEWQPSLVIVVLVLVWQIAWSAISPQFLGQSQMARIVVVVVSLFPVGLAMGIPFSAGLTVVGQTDPRLVPIAWCTNGLFTVIGSVSALAIALLAGFNIMMLVGVALYALTLMPIRWLGR